MAGLGGLLYGIDVGIIAGALPHLEATAAVAWKLDAQQVSFVVAAVLMGSVLSSLFAGTLSDRLGRKPVLVLSGALFSMSVPVIALAGGYGPLLAGRLLQGASGGLIGVVVPLYLAETLGPGNRGRGTAIFQLLLTAGLVAAALAGFHYGRQVDRACALAGRLQDPAAGAGLVFAARDRAWRDIFWVTLAPGLLFTIGALRLPESPRWLFRRGRAEAARATLVEIGAEPSGPALLAMARVEQANSGSQPLPGLLRRRYVFPFLLACAILACNQATGVNSILAYIVHILNHAGLPGSMANLGDAGLKGVNLIMTGVAVILVDHKGRRFLLLAGSGGICIALVLAGALFLGAPAPSERHGWLVAACLAGFMASFAVGPGVCAWLALSELMPARIRSNGMSVALLVNQLVSTAIAAAYLPMVARYGDAAMFFSWAGCAALYFLIVLRFLPETRGLSLEQIEANPRLRGSPGQRPSGR